MCSFMLMASGHFQCRELQKLQKLNFSSNTAAKRLFTSKLAVCCPGTDRRENTGEDKLIEVGTIRRETSIQIYRASLLRSKLYLYFQTIIIKVFKRKANMFCVKYETAVAVQLPFRSLRTHIHIYFRQEASMV